MSITNENPVMTMPVMPAYANGMGGNCGGMGCGWGGSWDSWIILFLIFGLFGGWGNGGYGNGGYGGQALTRGELCQDMNFNELKSAVQSNGTEMAAGFRNIDNAVCQLGYNNAQLANGIQMQVANGFGTLDTSLCQLGNNISQQINGVNVGIMQGQNAIQSQLASCCCDIREGISGVNYNMAMNANATQGAIRDGFCQTNFNAQTNTRDIIESQNANTRAILDKLTAQEIAAKDAQIAAQNQQIFGLQLKASQEAQNNYLVQQLGQKCPIPAYLTCNPNAPLNYSVNYGNGGCGCA